MMMKRIRKLLTEVFLLLAFYKDSTAVEVLNKCREAVWERSSKNYQYFLADGSGAMIDACSFENAPWTISNYVHVSAAKYPSRVRLYCARRHSGNLSD